MKYIIHIDGLGYYAGRNKKYADIFNITIKEFAKKFDTIEEAEKVAQVLKADGYDVEIEPITSNETGSESLKAQKGNTMERSNDKLYQLCNKHQWFTCGTSSQYEKLFYAYENGAPLDEIVTIIWLCSDDEKWCRRDIREILEEEGM